MECARLAREIRDVALLRGQFVLRSGAISSVYWDKYRFESDPTLLVAIADAMRDILPDSFDRLAGLELGGIPLATALSIATAKPCLYVRKAAKPYGTSNLVDGGFAPGERAVVVEDVVTSGGQIVTSVQQMRDLGLVVTDAICVVDRQQGGAENLATIGCALRSVFTMAELERLAHSGME
ncbi:MAG: orotate phosphoribosyltransferase [Chloroflexota bacterium]